MLTVRKLVVALGWPKTYLLNNFCTNHIFFKGMIPSELGCFYHTPILLLGYFISVIHETKNIEIVKTP